MKQGTWIECSLLEKAYLFANALGIKDFLDSLRWLQRFQPIIYKGIWDEAAVVNNEWKGYGFQ